MTLTGKQIVKFQCPALWISNYLLTLEEFSIISMPGSWLLSICRSWLTSSSAHEAYHYLVQRLKKKKKRSASDLNALRLEKLEQGRAMREILTANVAGFPLQKYHVERQMNKNNNNNNRFCSISMQTLFLGVYFILKLVTFQIDFLSSQRGIDTKRYDLAPRFI